MKKLRVLSLLPTYLKQGLYTKEVCTMKFCRSFPLEYFCLGILLVIFLRMKVVPGLPYAKYAVQLHQKPDMQKN